MPWDVYDLLKGGEQLSKDLLGVGQQPNPLDYGDPIAYAEAVNTYRHRAEEADVIEFVRFGERAPDAVITVQIRLTEHGDARVLPRRYFLAAVAY